MFRDQITATLETLAHGNWVCGDHAQHRWSLFGMILCGFWGYVETDEGRWVRITEKGAAYLARNATLPSHLGTFTALE